MAGCARAGISGGDWCVSEPVLEKKTCPKCEQYSRRRGVGQKVEACNPSTQETQQAALCEEASLVYISESKGSLG